MSLCPVVSHLSTNFAVLAPTLLLGACLAVSCGGDAPSPVPSPSPIPAPVPPPMPTPTPPGSGQLPDMEGEWSGTLESSSFSTRTIAAMFFQEADEVEGTWYTVDPGPRWIGAIGAFAGPGSLKGDMYVEFPVSGRPCSGVGTLTGEATSNTATLRWAVTSYSTNTCTANDVPNQMMMRLQR